MKALSLFVALSIFVGLPAQLEAQTKPNMFPTRGACEAAVNSGEFSSYEPKNFALKGKNPRPGTTLDSVRLEQPGCFDMLTFRGYQWVSLGTGTMVLRCNGIICGDSRCGNPIRGFSFPTPHTPATRPIPGPTRNSLTDTIRVLHEFVNPLRVEHVNASPVFPVEHIKVRSRGIWCFRNIGNGLVCTAVLAGAIYGATQLIGGDDGPGVRTDSVKVGPGVTTDSAKVGTGGGNTGDKCVATTYPNNCPSGISALRASESRQPPTWQPRFNVSPADRRIMIGASRRF